jgi:hypothetical protein
MPARDATVAGRVAQPATRTVAQQSAALACAVLLSVASIAAACTKTTASADAGQKPDAAVACLGAVVCDGTAVRACRAGQVAEVLQQCAPERGCSLGRCVSPACVKAQQDGASILGCTFYTFDLDNVTADDAIPTSVVVTNPGQVGATVTLERRSGAASSWTTTQSAIVPPMRSTRFALADSHFEGGGLAPSAAFRLTSDLPVSVMHVQSDDSATNGSTSSGGTLLLPAHVLGTRYRALTYAQVATPQLQNTPGSRGGAGQVVLVGTADDTHVTISPSATANLGPDAGLPPPDPVDNGVHFTLDEGDLFTLFSNRDGADLSGTEISSDLPLAVFSGNISTTYGITATGTSSPDLAHEQLLPVSMWGTAYVAAQLTPEAGVCDPLLTDKAPPYASLWTIVADHDDTQVHFQVASGPPPAPDRTIGAGETFHFSAIGSFVVNASGPIEIMQGIDCEPTLSSAVPTAIFLTDLWFGVLPNFETWITIVRPPATPPTAPPPTVYRDGAPIEEGAFVPAGGGYQVVSLPLEACPPEAGACAHHLEGRFGLTMRGMDVLSSWALTVPTWCVDTGTTGTNCIK